ncbi:MAG: hypothetical protein E6Q97_23865 [Desulfurellales bacterium]|nr:MAG: hypothetical protein E6Q97_23865 [Desulfurellales bacterium]
MSQESLIYLLLGFITGALTVMILPRRAFFRRKNRKPVTIDGDALRGLNLQFPTSIVVDKTKTQP